MKNQMMIIIIAVVGVGAFLGGMRYQQGQRPTFNNQLNGRFGARGVSGPAGMMRGANGFRPVTGEIISADDSSITVKMPDGSSKIVLISGATQINKAQSAVKSDLTVGNQVMVVGATNSDGSVTAQNIQLDPMFRGATPSAAEK